MAFLVHGVSRRLPDATARDDAPSFRVVADGELLGLVSEIEEDEAMPTRANLLHHTRVLEHVTEHATVLPMRFGIVVPDLDALVDDFLHPERERLYATLDRLEGHVELRLSGRYQEAHVIREVLDSDPQAARLRGRQSTEAKMELGERIVAGIERRRAADTARVTERLRPHATAVAEGPTAESLDAFSLSFLISSDDREGFESTVDAIGDDLAPVVHLELVGPLPPFSFTDAREPTWG